MTFAIVPAVKRKPLTAIGVALAVLGTVWVLQGTNVLPGSFMTGQLFWAGAGAVLIVVAALTLWAAWRPRAPRA